MIRRLPALTLLAAVAALAPAARASAGFYAVKACYGDGINNSWSAARSNGYADAYVQCPGGAIVNGSVNEGMVARNTGGAGLAPFVSNARVYFDAPPGTRIVAINGQIMQNSSGGWQAGIHDDGLNRWIWCGDTCLSTFGYWVNFNIGGLSTGRVAALAICGAGGGCSRNGLHGYAAIRDVTVTLADEAAPSVSFRGGSLISPGWKRGVQDLVFDATDASGVQTATVRLDGRTMSEHGGGCDDTRPAPCPIGRRADAIDTRTLPDGRHILRIDATDAAGNRSTNQRVVSTDNHAPSRPSGLSQSGGGGWKSRDDFTLSWSNPAQSAAPISAAFVAVCPFRRKGLAGCSIRRLTRTATSVAGLTVPGPGRWTAKVWLADAAGNADPANTAETILQLDDAPPMIAFEPQAIDHPTIVRVTARDQGSGLNVREILLRRKGSTEWMSLPITSQPDGFSATIEDEVLRDGVYQLRARAVDEAGNERSTDRRADGKLAELLLPLRVKSHLAVGKPKRVRARGSRGKRRYRIKLVEEPRARYGRTIPLRGRLTSPGGNPLASREVQVFEKTNLPAAPWHPIATLRTSDGGRFRFRAVRGPSRTLRFRFAGSATVRGETADVRLGVRASTTMRVNRHQVVNGEDVAFSGRLRSRPLPTIGKLVELQAYARGRWLTFKTVRANPRTGRWSYRYRFSATRGNVRYRFRAQLPQEAGYPYEMGVSSRVEVSVRGL